MYRTSLSCAWLHSWLAGGRLEPLYIILVTTREAPHKQNHDQGAYVPTSNYDQGAYPQTELCTYVRLCRDLAGWLAELCMSVQPGSLSCAWLADEAQRGRERRSVERTSLSCAWLEAPEGLCNTHMHTLQVAALLVGMLRGGLGRFGNAWECFREAWGGLGRLREGLWEVLGE